MTTSPAEDRFASILKRLALVMALAIGIGLPGGYFSLKYSSLIEHVENTSQIKAETITSLVTANPELWTHQPRRMEQLLLLFSPSLNEDITSVRDAAGKLLIAVGVTPDAPVLVRSSPIYDSGRVVGQVEVAHSSRTVWFGTLAAGLLGLLLGVMVYVTLLILPLRALRRLNIALGEREHRFQMLFDRATEGIVISSSDGKIIEVNEAFARMHGYSMEEMLNMGMKDLDTPENLRLLPERLRKTDSGESLFFETAHYHKDGHVIPMEVSASLLDSGGERLLQAFHRDITARKQAEIALERQKDLYDMLSQTNQAIVRITSREELFPAVCRIAVEHGRFRFALIAMIDQNDAQMKPVARYGTDIGYIDQLDLAGDDVGDLRQNLAGRISLSGAHVISNDFLNDPAMAPWHEAARRASVHAAATFSIREGGVVVGVIVLYAGDPGYFTEELVATLDEMAFDVSFALDNYMREAMRKRAEAALGTSEAQLHCVLGATADGILAVDNNGKVIQTNPRFAKMWQIPQALLDSGDDQALLNFVVSQLLDPEAFLEKVRSLYGSDVDSVDMLIFKDGRVFERYSSPLRLYDSVTGRVWSFRDITERARAEEMLRAKEEQFRGLVEQEIAGIYIIQDSKFAYVNQRFAKIRGYSSADEIIGRDILQLVAEKDRGVVAEHNRMLLAGEKRDTDFSFTALRKDGSSVEVGVHSTIANHRGRPAIIGLMQDISEKKRVEERIQYYIAQLKTAFMSTVEVATSLSELRDPYTVGHERRVAQIAVAISAELGFDESRQEGLRVASFLHDIGKITIPAEILSKPGNLSAIEVQLVQGHVLAGYEVLKAVEFPWPVAQIVLQHHERMDGSGFPQGLKGEAILLEARIMAVADVVEAMSSHRPYRPGFGIEIALAEIEHWRGTLYDPAATDACLRLFQEKGYVLPG